MTDIKLIPMAEVNQLELERMNNAVAEDFTKLKDYFAGIMLSQADYLDINDNKAVDFLERTILSLKIYVERKTGKSDNPINTKLSKIIDMLEEDRRAGSFLDFDFNNMFNKDYCAGAGAEAVENLKYDDNYLENTIISWRQKSEELYNYQQTIKMYKK